MSSDVDRFMDDLDKTITEIFAALEQRKPITISQKKSSMGLDITTNISISLGLLEYLGTPKYEKLNEGPPIDVIESEHDVKIIAIISGIRKEDIQTTVHSDSIEMQIKKENQLFHRKIFCNTKLNNLVIRSLNYNNSVLEIIFDKEGKP